MGVDSYPWLDKTKKKKELYLETNKMYIKCLTRLPPMLLQQKQRVNKPSAYQLICRTRWQRFAASYTAADAVEHERCIGVQSTPNFSPVFLCQVSELLGCVLIYFKTERLKSVKRQMWLEIDGDFLQIGRCESRWRHLRELTSNNSISWMHRCKEKKR